MAGISSEQLIEVDFGEAVERGLPGWSVLRPTPGTPTGEVWVHALPPGTPGTPTQGWKLHVSATLINASTVLDRALPVLAARCATFKVAHSGGFLARLNGGQEGASQVGKFITIYPADDLEAVELARLLADATSGLDAPTVPSDRRIGDTPVHYRYGSFANLAVQNALGQPQLGVIDPDGIARPDVRSMRYRKPDWVEDPFEARGLVGANEERVAHIVDGRFLRLLPVAIGARGAIHRGVDLAEGREVILKFANPAHVISADGADASTRLLNEAKILALLPPDARAPEPYAHGIHEGETYLAMEEIVGRTAGEHVQAARIEGRCIDAARARRWAIDVAHTLRSMHELGQAYRDVKLTNVMIDERDDRARLIDFELATPLGTPHGQGEAGSRGYVAPRLAERSVGVGDDIYGFGAFVWALATSSEPSAQPAEHDLDRLDPLLLNPDADEQLLALSAWCRRPDPGDRPASMQAVLDSLAGEPVAARRRPIAADRWTALALRTGEALVERCIPDGGFSTWPSVRRVGGGMAVRTIYEGSAGIALALASLVGAGHDRFRGPLDDSVRWLVDGDDGLPHVPGLFSGEMGVAVAVAVAGHVLDDARLLARAVELGDLEVEPDLVGADLVMGAAGIARGHLVLAALTGSDEHLHRSLELGDWLLGAVDGDDDGAFWALPESLPRIGGWACYGYGHGVAGIADVLFDLAAAHGAARFADHAERAIDWVVAGAMERGDGIDWPEAPGEHSFGGWWCHGAAGIAPVLARAGRREPAMRAMRHSARMVWGGPGRCHGLAGNIELLVRVGELLDHSAATDAAVDLGRVLADWEIAPGVYPGESPELVTPDYMVGVAGVIPAFLRLAGHPPIDPTFTSGTGALAGLTQRPPEDSRSG